MAKLSRIVAMTAVVAIASTTFGDEKDQRLDIYFIDVEGGAATLMVTPEGESLLVDSGYPDNQGRDLNRILHVLRNVAGKKTLDHSFVSHWHTDHYGNHAALAAEVGIGTFWDRGIPDDLQEDRNYLTRVSQYRAACQNESRALSAGDSVPLKSGETPLALKVLTSGRDVVPNHGPLNPHVRRHEERDVDTSDNAASLSLLMSFGDFRFLCCGDLTWNIEARLVTPRNPVGTVDLFMVTHHGLPSSNNPALVLAIDPTVAVMCNGHRKGGAPETIATLREVASLQDWFQLHRNVALADDEQAPAELIANQETTESCRGRWVKASVAPDGKSFTVQISDDGAKREYQTRTH